MCDNTGVDTSSWCFMPLPQEPFLLMVASKKSDDYTALIKKAKGGEMRADAFQEIRHLKSSTAANWVSFDHNVSCSSC